MRLYRFELMFDGIPQGCGFLTGLDSIGLPIDRECDVIEPFETLPCPYISERCEFWFTESGMDKYASAIDELLWEISENGWGLCAAILEISDFSQALYHDELQAAWPVGYLDTSEDKFIEIQEARDVLSRASNCFPKL